MHTVEQWLGYHNIVDDIILDVIHAFDGGVLSTTPDSWSVRPRNAEAVHLPDMASCFSRFVCGSLVAVLDPDGSRNLKGYLDRVRFETPAASVESVAAARYDLSQGISVVSLPWDGRPSDLMCLAHEAGHAVQHAFSKTDDMPQIARETCAFLAELIVLDALSVSHSNIYAAARTAWEDANSFYFGANLDLLSRSLKTPTAPYTYRLNYPLARLGATYLYNAALSENVPSFAQITSLFESGPAGMQKLPVHDLGQYATRIKNTLPAFPNEEESALAAYRSLGAMTLLDLETIADPLDVSIGDYFQNKLSCLQDGTVFIALHQDQRPFGYLTWARTDANTAAVLQHRAVPFDTNARLTGAFAQHTGLALTTANTAREDAT